MFKLLALVLCFFSSFSFAISPLKIQGKKIVDEQGNPVQLKGMSLFWSQWSESFWNRENIKTLKEDWNANLVRAAMGIEMGGYLENPEKQKALLKEVLNAAIENDLYVIIDWHDHNANVHLEASKAFFREMAESYCLPNVIFEIWNEPISVSWGLIKNYAEPVIEEIRKTGCQNIIIVGTPLWSQNVDEAANSPLEAANIAYALHFYAGTHKDWLRRKAEYALSKDLALFVSEMGLSSASGDGGLDLIEAERWFAWMDQHEISWANWSLFNKRESSSAIQPWAKSIGPWSNGELTQSGKIIKNKLRGIANGASLD